MKKLTSVIIALLFIVIISLGNIQTAKAATQTSITRSEVEQRALDIINLTWTYSKDKNGNVPSGYSQYVTQPAQFANVTNAQFTGIPYDWGGIDGIDSSSYDAPWASFVDAINQGAFAGNINTSSGYGYVAGTAGMDCSGFVQAAFDIKDYKQSTTTLLNNYFTQINLNDIQHMDILDKPGVHCSIFDKWGTLNGVQGAFTYEATPDQTYGGIQGTKRYFLTMSQINSGYVAARYKYIIDDTTTSSTVTQTTTSGTDANQGATGTTVSSTGTTAGTGVDSTSTAVSASGSSGSTDTPGASTSTDTAASTSSNITSTDATGTSTSDTNTSGTGAASTGTTSVTGTPNTSGASTTVTSTTSASGIVGTNSSSTSTPDTSVTSTTSTTTAATSTSALPHPINAGVFAKIANVTSFANFRANPSTSAAIIGTLSLNTILYMSDYSNGWYKVNYNGQTGWVWGNLIAPIPSGKYVTVKGVYFLNIRSSASPTATIVGALSKNQYAEVLGYSSDGSWWEISINGVTGWSYSPYLSYIY